MTLLYSYFLWSIWLFSSDVLRLEQWRVLHGEIWRKRMKFHLGNFSLDFSLWMVFKEEIKKVTSYLHFNLPNYLPIYLWLLWNSTLRHRLGCFTFLWDLWIKELSTHWKQSSGRIILPIHFKISFKILRCHGSNLNILVYFLLTNKDCQSQV